MNSPTQNGIPLVLTHMSERNQVGPRLVASGAALQRAFVSRHGQQPLLAATLRATDAVPELTTTGHSANLSKSKANAEEKKTHLK